MCGIVGAVSARNVVPILIDGIRRLEYRGYDSSGLCVIAGATSTLRSIGLADVLVAKWMANWAGSWGIAFPAVLIVLPVVRFLVARIVAPPPAR